MMRESTERLGQQEKRRAVAVVRVAKVESEAPLAKVESEAPLAKVESEAPLAKVESEAPLAKVESEAPLAKAESEAPLAMGARAAVQQVVARSKNAARTGIAWRNPCRCPKAILSTPPR
jgi:hypothetical protein